MVAALVSDCLLLARCQQIAGLSFLQLAEQVGMRMPQLAAHRKGFIGQCIERALGASAGSKPIPDFPELDIELKTIPVGKERQALESTFVCSISFEQIAKESFETSLCYKKLRRVLWIPIEGDTVIPYPERRLGLGFLWSMDAQERSIIQQDWQELSDYIRFGEFDAISAHLGEYLQIRPKAANSQKHKNAIDAEGERIRTLPLGFYLRPAFTNGILARCLM